MAFFTIFIPSGLSEAGYRRAARVTAPGTASRRRQQTNLLMVAGFVDLEEFDCTDEYLHVARAWLEARLRHYDELVRAEGEAAVKDRIRRGRATIRTIEAGLLRRALFVGRSP